MLNLGKEPSVRSRRSRLPHEVNTNVTSFVAGFIQAIIAQPWSSIGRPRHSFPSVAELPRSESPLTRTTLVVHLAVECLEWLTLRCAGSEFSI